MSGPVSVLQVDADWVQARRLSINMVLGTDLKKHFDIVSRFQARLQTFFHSHNLLIWHMVTQHVQTHALLQEGKDSKTQCWADRRSPLPPMAPFLQLLAHASRLLFFVE